MSSEREALKNLREVYGRWAGSTPPELANAVQGVLDACGPQPCECGHPKGRHRLTEAFGDSETFGACIEFGCACEKYRRDDDAE